MSQTNRLKNYYSPEKALVKLQEKQHTTRLSSTPFESPLKPLYKNMNISMMKSRSPQQKTNTEAFLASQNNLLFTRKASYTYWSMQHNFTGLNERRSNSKKAKSPVQIGQLSWMSATPRSTITLTVSQNLRRSSKYEKNQHPARVAKINLERNE